MSGTIAPVGKHTFWSNPGIPLAGGWLYTFAAGTSTPIATYQDSTLTTPNANPIPLDSAGRCTIFIGAVSMKWILKDALFNTIWTLDNIQASQVGQAVLGEAVVLGGDPTSPVVGTTYPVGATADKLHAGTIIYAVDAALLTGTYILQGMLKGTGGGTITAAIVNLSDGSPEVPLATIASAHVTGELKQSAAITFAAGGASKNYGIKVKVDTGGGWAWGLSLVRTA